MSGQHVIDMVGETYNRLTVLRRVELNTKWTEWECICTCGNTKIVSRGNLRQGCVQSCGCLRRETFPNLVSRGDFGVGEKSGKWTGYGGIPGTYWKNVRNSAKAKDRVLEITIKDAWELFLEQDRKCALSGVELKFSTHVNKYLGTASLDRIDSSIGYIKGNVQWVHKDVNRMKSNFSEKYFREICKLVSRNTK